MTNKIMLLKKEFNVYIAMGIETGIPLFSSTDREFVLNHAIQEARILVVDETFKTKEVK